MATSSQSTPPHLDALTSVLTSALQERRERGTLLSLATLGGSLTGIQETVTGDRWRGTDFVRGGAQPPIPSLSVHLARPTSYNDSVNFDQLKQQRAHPRVAYFDQSYAWGPMIGQGFLDHHSGTGLHDYARIPWSMATGVHLPEGGIRKFATPATKQTSSRWPIPAFSQTVTMPGVSKPPTMIFGGEGSQEISAMMKSRQAVLGLVNAAQQTRARGQVGMQG